MEEAQNNNNGKMNNKPRLNNARNQRVEVGEDPFGPWILVQRGRKQKKIAKGDSKGANIVAAN